MRNNDDGWIKDISPLNKETAKILFDKVEAIAIGMQTAFNAIQRQSLTNLGILALHQDKTNPLNFSSLTNGLGSRFLYQGVATYPALQIRKIMTDKTDLSQFFINFATTGIETILGVPLEVNSSIKTLKSLGVDIAKKDLLSVSAKTFFPFFIRNSLAWCAINSNPDNDSLLSKMGYGAFAGFLSTPFHNIGIKTMENSISKNWNETWEAVSKEICKQPSNLFKGAGFRAISIAATALVLSPKTTDYFTEMGKKIFNDYLSILSVDQKPSPSPSKVLVNNFLDNKGHQK